MAMYMLPNILALPFAGLVVDRIDGFINAITCIAYIYGFINNYDFIYSRCHIRTYGRDIPTSIFCCRAKVFVPEIRNNALTQMSNQGIRLIGPAGLIVSVASAG